MRLFICFYALGIWCSKQSLRYFFIPGVGQHLNRLRAPGLTKTVKVWLRWARLDCRRMEEIVLWYRRFVHFYCICSEIEQRFAASSESLNLWLDLADRMIWKVREFRHAASCFLVIPLRESRNDLSPRSVYYNHIPESLLSPTLRSRQTSTDCKEGREKNRSVTPSKLWTKKYR